jgi:hypothetical protein
MRAVLPSLESCQTCCKDNKCGTESECFYQKLFVCVSVCTIGCLVIIIAIRMLIGCKQESMFPFHSFENYSTKVTDYFISKQDYSHCAIFVAHKVIKEPEYTAAIFQPDPLSSRAQFSTLNHYNKQVTNSLKHACNQRSIYSSIASTHLKMISFEGSDFLSNKNRCDNCDLESSKSC